MFRIRYGIAVWHYEVQNFFQISFKNQMWEQNMLFCLTIPPTKNRHIQPDHKIFYPWVQCLISDNENPTTVKSCSLWKPKVFWYKWPNFTPDTRTPTKQREAPAETRCFIHEPNTLFMRCNHETVMNTFSCPEPSSKVQCLTFTLQTSSKHKPLHRVKSWFLMEVQGLTPRT